MDLGIVWSTLCLPLFILRSTITKYVYCMAIKMNFFCRGSGVLEGGPLSGVPKGFPEPKYAVSDHKQHETQVFFNSIYLFTVVTFIMNNSTEFI